MKRTVFLFVAGFAPMLAACASVTEGGMARQKAKIRIAVIGDSMSIGVGAAAPENAYVFQSFLALQARFPQAQLICLGSDDATVGEVMRNQVPRLRSYSPDAVIVCSGFDSVSALNDPVEFSYDYDALLRAIRSTMLHAAIICCGIVDVLSAARFSAVQRAALSDIRRSDNIAIRRLASRYQAKFVPATLLDRSLRPAEISDDGWHPNDSGYAIMKETLSITLLATILAEFPHHVSLTKM